MQTTIRLTDELYEQLRKFAKEKGLSINAVVVNTLWEYVKSIRENENYVN